MEAAGDPVGPYIRAQGRFRHVSDEDIARIQADVDARWEHLQRLVATSQ
jgi:pyruvate/2-oxoacid:ferredoxin oxidoreductase beta subunit